MTFRKNILILFSQIILVFACSEESFSQCTNYNVQVNNGGGAAQVSWQLFNSAGVMVLSGGAPFDQDICLPDDCYTLWMYDDGGDGWNSIDWVIEDFTGDFDFDTNLGDGNSEVDQFETGDAVCDPITVCPAGQSLFTIDVDDGNDADEISWELYDSSGNAVAFGVAPWEEQLCLPNDCYTLWMYDSAGDGWPNSTWTIEDANGDLVFASFLVDGFDLSENFAIGPVSCAPPCTVYTIEVSDGIDTPDVSWELIDSFGVLQASGGANELQNVCLLDDCYSLVMYDDAGNGWQDVVISIYDLVSGFTYQTFLVSGSQFTQQVAIGNANCNVIVNCPVGSQEYTFSVSSGASPSEISWYFSLNNNVLQGGGAPFTGNVCLNTGCYYLQTFDQGGDGWNGATYTLINPLGVIVASGTFDTGSSGYVLVNIGGLNCAGTEPPTGGACGSSPPTADCFSAPCVCDIYNFHISPTGFGSINEVPPPGGVSNPSFFGSPPWGGPATFGCLLAGELNSHWMVFTVATSGNLEFSFGAGGQQMGFYDWAMWPYTGPATCNGIANNTLAPVRCVWNAAASGGAGLASVIPPGGFSGNYAPPLPVIAGQKFIICLSNWSFVSTMVTLDFFGTATIGCNLVLPVELIGFNGHPNDKGVLLHWETQTEINNDYFIVEQSIDNMDWVEIGHVKGHGTTEAPQQYFLQDLHPHMGENYYRLKQFDYDGLFKVSKTIVIEYIELARLVCKPNPAGDHVSLEYNNDRQPTLVQILDNNGRLVLEEKNVMTFPYQLNTSTWLPSTYIVRCSSNYSNSVSKLVILH